MNGLNLDLDAFQELLTNSELEEVPATFEQFVHGEEYLNMPSVKFSSIQKELILKSTMVYRRETVIEAWGEEEGGAIWDLATSNGRPVNELIAMLGKGSGKNFSTVVSFLYVIHLLLCLKDPARYFGKPPGDHIDLLNIATNAEQANKNFFEPLSKRAAASPWMSARMVNERAKDIEFDKSIRVNSGHAKTEAWEGYNVLMIVLDEIAAFNAEDGTTTKVLNAAEIYDMSSNSVTSRFPLEGKLILLSFPRYKGDFIQKRYDAVIAEKETVTRRHLFTMHEDLPADTEGNQFEIQWEEDRIVSYYEPGVYAIRRPSWEVNPTRNIDMYKNAFFKDKIQALMRFACMPPSTTFGLFKDEDKVRAAFPDGKPGPFTDDWRFKKSFRPNPEYAYYLHIDLAQNNDRAVVAMAHSPGFVKVPGWDEPVPKVVVDCVRWWESENGEDIDWKEMREFVLDLRRRGFNIVYVSTDKWQSVSFRNELDARGVDAGILSVGKPHFDELVLLVAEQRVHGYELPMLRDELLSLRVEGKTKVTAPPGLHDDLAFATCGAVFHAAMNATDMFDEVSEVDIQIIDPGMENATNVVKDKKDKVVERPDMPPDVAEFLASMELI